MSEANKQVALKVLKAIGEADGEEFARYLSPDFITHTKGFARVSGIRDRETSVGTLSALKAVAPTGIRPKISKVIADGDTVAIECEGNAVLSNGQPYCNQYVFVFTFADGKVKQINEYFCTFLADKLITPLLAEMSDAFPA